MIIIFQMIVILLFQNHCHHDCHNHHLCHHHDYRQAQFAHMQPSRSKVRIMLLIIIMVAMIIIKIIIEVNIIAVVTDINIMIVDRAQYFAKDLDWNVIGVLDCCCSTFHQSHHHHNHHYHNHHHDHHYHHDHHHENMFARDCCRQRVELPQKGRSSRRCRVS